MSKWAVKSDKVDEIRNYILAEIITKVRSWNTTQKVIAQRLGTDRVRTNRIMVRKVEGISLEALIDYAEVAGLDVSLNVSDKKESIFEAVSDCVKCRHIHLDNNKDTQIIHLQERLEFLEQAHSSILAALKLKN